VILVVLLVLAGPQPTTPGINRVEPEEVSRRQATDETEEETLQAEQARVLVMEATAYSYTGSRTATGTWPKRGTVAVDPKVIPFGARLEIEGYGPGLAEDTGGAIRGNRVDLFMESEAEALAWGRRMVKVKIYENN
jgi:3D (Asp-Asp-Asp) domain-containing protein